MTKRSLLTTLVCNVRCKALSTISGSVFFPHRVATGQHGVLYVDAVFKIK